MLVSKRAAPKLGLCVSFWGTRGLAFYDLEESSIFLRLIAELAGKYALIVIFVCLCVGMWGILAGVYILAVKSGSFISVSLSGVRVLFLLYHIFVFSCESLSFLLFPFCRCF